MGQGSNEEDRRIVLSDVSYVLFTPLSISTLWFNLVAFGQNRLRLELVVLTFAFRLRWPYQLRFWTCWQRVRNRLGL